jgi:hypothetical protein
MVRAEEKSLKSILTVRERSRILKRMGLTYHFEFKAPATVTAGELETFLRGIERQAKAMDFRPTMVLNAVFDSAERKQFARRLTTGLPVEDARLKRANVPDDGRVWHLDTANGMCRVPPVNGVVLVVTDEGGRETIFGFLRFLETLREANGEVVAETGLGGSWYFGDHIKSGDSRFRKIVRKFADAGYLKQEVDEFASAKV